MKLFRQVHPIFVQEGKITSQVFRPTPKDQLMLSCYNSSMISAKQSYEHFTKNPDCQSVGVVSVLEAECTQEQLNIVHDGVPFPEHSSIDFSPYNEGQRKKKSKKLADLSSLRGFEYKP